MAALDVSVEIGIPHRSMHLGHVFTRHIAQLETLKISLSTEQCPS